MKYTLQIKTGDAEYRALKNIPKEIFANPNFRLLIEITRGRKSKNDKIGDLQKRVDALDDFLDPSSFVFFDITSEESLSNEQIDQLYDFQYGYVNWRILFAELHTQYPNAVPMLLVNDQDNDYTNFVAQIKTFTAEYNKIGYKIYPAVDEDIIEEEIKIIRDNIKEDTQLFIFYDQGYIVDGLIKMATARAVDYLGKTSAILETVRNVEYIFTSTSFPDSVTSLSGNMDGHIKCSEMLLYDQIISAVKDINVSYSDYGSITPKRNDEAAYYSRGWTPRIDVPTISKQQIYYYRQKREKRDYADVYIDVAKKCISDSLFPSDVDCWGVKTIRSAATGFKPGATPSFWLSVRMNIFIIEQLKRLSIIQ